MSSYFKPREQYLQLGTQVYTSPLLLAGALEQLERLAEKRNSDSKYVRRAGPGCVVDLLDLKDMSQASFELVMPNEAAPRSNRISVLSPLGASLLGMATGEISRVKLWGYNYSFQILGIRNSGSITMVKEESTS